MVKWVLIGFFVYLLGELLCVILSEMRGKPLGLWVSFLSFFVLFSLYPCHRRLSRTLNVTVHFSLGRKMSSGMLAPRCQFPCSGSSGKRGGSLILKKTVNLILCSMMPAEVPTRHQPHFFITWLFLWELELLCW